LNIDDSCDVCIAGAGPVGLTIALGLAPTGRRIVLLEREPGPSTEWRASTFHPPTLEMCDTLGVTAEMIERGLIADRYQIRGWGNEPIAEFDLRALRSDTKYPFRLQLEQYKYSEILREHLARYPNVDLQFGRSFERADDRGDVVDVMHRGVAEDLAAVRARWVIGTDGASSAVRGHLGVGFEGLTYPDKQLILSIDAPLLEWFPDLCYVNYISSSGAHPGMVLKIPDVWRVSSRIPDEVDDDTALGDRFVNDRLAEILPGHEVPEPVARRIFKIHQRVADRLRVGRVLLAGDAAHINSPRGGMGLNGGIHDAMDLIPVLTEVLDGGAAVDQLDQWAERRRVVAKDHVQKTSHRYTTELRRDDADALRAGLERYVAISNDPSAARSAMLESSMITSVQDQRERLGARF
jgi:3-(3-hydroxy-phenyl)propionate hydroxylase